MEIREIDRNSKDDINMLSKLFQEYAEEIQRDLSASIAQELSELPYFIGFMAFDKKKATCCLLCLLRNLFNLPFHECLKNP